MKIKAECNVIKAPLPIIDAENGCVSVSATGCEKYMSLLRYGQYGQVGVDGVWRDKEKDTKKTDDKKVTEKSGEKSDEKKRRKKVTKKTQEKYDAILNAMQPNEWYKVSEFEAVVGVKESRIKILIRDLVEQGLLESKGSTKGKMYRKVITE